MIGTTDSYMTKLLSFPLPYCLQNSKCLWRFPGLQVLGPFCNHNSAQRCCKVWSSPQRSKKKKQIKPHPSYTGQSSTPSSETNVDTFLQHFFFSYLKEGEIRHLTSQRFIFSLKFKKTIKQNWPLSSKIHFFLYFFPPTLMQCEIILPMLLWLYNIFPSFYP